MRKNTKLNVFFQAFILPQLLGLFPFKIKKHKFVISTLSLGQSTAFFAYAVLNVYYRGIPSNLETRMSIINVVLAFITLIEMFLIFLNFVRFLISVEDFNAIYFSIENLSRLTYSKVKFNNSYIFLIMNSHLAIHVYSAHFQQTINISQIIFIYVDYYWVFCRLVLVNQIYCLMSIQINFQKYILKNLRKSNAEHFTKLHRIIEISRTKLVEIFYPVINVLVFKFFCTFICSGYFVIFALSTNIAYPAFGLAVLSDLFNIVLLITTFRLSTILVSFFSLYQFKIRINITVKKYYLSAFAFE